MNPSIEGAKHHNHGGPCDLCDEHAAVIAKLQAGTHVLMPVKTDGEMCDAIWKYYSTRIQFQDKPDSDACKAACWSAMMAYYAMVDVVKQRPLIDGSHDG